MANSELKIIWKPEIVIKNNNFSQYTNFWTAQTTGKTIVEPIYTTLAGWDWNAGKLIHQYGNTDSIWQDFTEPDVLESEYELQFFIQFYNTGGSVVPNLFGNAGTTITSTGNYRIKIAAAANNATIKFTPTVNFYGYITDVRIVSIKVKTESVDLYDDEDIALTFQVSQGISSIRRTTENPAILQPSWHCRGRRQNPQPR